MTEDNRLLTDEQLREVVGGLTLSVQGRIPTHEDFDFQVGETFYVQSMHGTVSCKVKKHGYHTDPYGLKHYALHYYLECVYPGNGWYSVADLNVSMMVLIDTSDYPITELL